ncbi:leucine-rich repeat domain-containing protein [Pedobacter sp.]
MFVKCNACGADVSLHSNDKDICEFCGNIQYKPIEKTKPIIDKKGGNDRAHKSKITSKPEITKPRFYTKRLEPSSLLDEYRVDGGVMGKYGRFRADYETREGNYSLALRNKDIVDLDEIFHWFSDNELDELEELDVSGNRITDISKAFTLKSLKILKASDNLIAELPKIDNPEQWEFEQIDLRNNRITSYGNFRYIRAKGILFHGNHISKIDDIKYIRYLDLSKNCIEDVSGMQNLFDNCPLGKTYTTIVLADNPIKNIEVIGNLTFNALPVKEYDNKVLDPNGDFDKIRRELTPDRHGYINYFDLERFPNTINNREFYICLRNKEFNVDGLAILTDRELDDGVLRPIPSDNYKFIKIKIGKICEWDEICEHFGLKIEGKSKMYSIYSKPLILVGVILIMIIGYFLFIMPKGNSHSGTDNYAVADTILADTTVTADTTEALLQDNLPIEEIIKQIRNDYYATTKLLNEGQLFADTLTSEEDYPYREIVYTHSDGDVVMIKQGSFSNALYEVTEYYFKDNKLYFSYSTADGIAHTKDYNECRKYYYNDTVFREIKDNVETNCTNNCYVGLESEPYKTLRKFLSSQGY